MVFSGSLIIASAVVVQEKFGELEAKELSLLEELETVRAPLVDKLNAFLNITNKESDLRGVLDTFYEGRCE